MDTFAPILTTSNASARLRRTNRMLRLPFAVLPFLFACSQEPSTEGGGTTPAPRQAPTATTAVPVDERDAWQRPEELVTMMGGDLSGLVVADLFAGDGYFTFKLIAAGANVIAIDNDPANIALLEAKKQEAGLGDDRLTLRTVPVGDPGLAPGEADAAVLVHRFADLADKRGYIGLLRRGLVSPRPLFIIEWQNRQTPMGPPVSQRMSAEAIMDELGASGYTDVGAHSAKIPYQVVLLATDPIGMDSGGRPW